MQIRFRPFALPRLFLFDPGMGSSGTELGPATSGMDYENGVVTTGFILGPRKWLLGEGFLGRGGYA